MEQEKEMQLLELLESIDASLIRIADSVAGKEQENSEEN